MTQTKVGWRAYVATTTASTLWNSIYSVYNADAVGSSSLKTSLYAAYNGESNANDSFSINNGTAQGGLTYTTGKIGNAFQFNGTNAYVNLPNTSGQFNFTGDFSVSMWFRSSNLSTSRYAIGNYKGGGSYGYGWQLYYSVAGGFAFDLRNGNNINQVRKIQTINTNTWYHVVAVRKMGQIHKLYVNGVDQSATQTDGNVNNIAGYLTNQPMDLGGLSDANAPALCDLDSINVWNKEITQSEITELYNSGNGAQYITDSFYKPTTNDALNTYNGTAQGGLTYGVGKVGTAFQFNGTNAYVQLPDNSLNSLTGDFTISMWVYLNSIVGGTLMCPISSIRRDSGNYYGVATYFQSGVPWLQIMRGGATTHIDLQASSNPLLVNTWNHVVFTHNSSGSKIYINDVVRATNTSSLNGVFHQTINYCSIGANQNTTYQYLFTNGSKIDALSVWQKQLTQTEITELYNSGNGKQYTN